MKTNEFVAKPVFYSSLLIGFSAFLFLAVLAPRVLFVFPFLFPAIWGGGFLARKLPVMPVSRPVLLFVIAIVFLTTFSLIWSVAPEDSFSRWLKIIPFLLITPLTLGIVQVTGIADKRLFFMPLALIFCAFVLYIEQILDFPLYRLFNSLDPDVTVRKSIVNRSLVVLVLIMVPAAAFFRPGQLNCGPYKLPFLLAMVLVAPPLFLSSSQSAQFAFVIAIISFLFLPLSKIWLWRSFQVLAVLGTLTAPWIVTQTFGRFSDVAAENMWLKKASAAERLEIWDFIGRRTLENPVYGYGLDSTRAMNFDSAMSYFDYNTVLHPHNMILQFWIEFGVIGALFCAVALVYILERIRKLEPLPRRYAFTSFVAWLSVALFGYGMWQSWWLGLTVMVGAVTVFAVKLVAFRIEASASTMEA